MTLPPPSSITAGLPGAPPFVGPETIERRLGRPFTARLGANESAFGPSPRAVEAVRAAAGDVWKYGDPESLELRTALAAHHGVEIGNIVCGVGIDALLSTVCRAFVEAGTPVVTSHGAYPTFSYYARGAGAVLHEVPYADDHEDLAALAARAHAERARIVYVANPDNPMGTWWSGAELERLRSELPTDTVLCLDEAYADMAPADALPSFAADDDGVIRFRTFSKAHGLAGLRMGYAIGSPAMLAVLDRVRDHFGIGRLGQIAALASLQDPAHLADVLERVTDARRRIGEIAAANGLSAIPSATNFVAIDCGRDGAYARGVVAALAERGVFIRMPGVAPLDRCVRISVGLPAALDVLAEALPAALAAV